MCIRDSFFYCCFLVIQVVFAVVIGELVETLSLRTSLRFAGQYADFLHQMCIRDRLGRMRLVC